VPKGGCRAHRTEPGIVPGEERLERAQKVVAPGERAAMASQSYGVPRAEVDTSGLLKRELEIG
jgi:hypothetical protein